jgi:hypothetical protein
MDDLLQQFVHDHEKVAQQRPDIHPSTTSPVTRIAAAAKGAT